MMQSKPEHIAIVMDGNRRWAESNGLKHLEGHMQGVESARKIIMHAIDRKINTLSLYTLSQENMYRTEEEVEGLFQIYFEVMNTDSDNLHSKGVKVKFIGDIAKLSDKIQAGIQELELLTKDNKNLNLLVALNYSGKWDILNAAKNIAKNYSNKVESIDDLNMEDFSKYLSTNNYPEPDLFIRTGGDYRVSNYYLWQMAYTELYFTDIFWPDFNEKEFDEALEDFARRERRFGVSNE